MARTATLVVDGDDSTAFTDMELTYPSPKCAYQGGKKL
jgi:hypothetical protein